MIVGASDLRPVVGAPGVGLRCVELGDILETTQMRPLVDLGEDVYAQVVEDRAGALGVHVHGKLSRLGAAVGGRCRLRKE